VFSGDFVLGFQRLHGRGVEYLQNGTSFGRLHQAFASTPPAFTQTTFVLPAHRHAVLRE
jgi:hypothetical protein